MGLKRNKLLVCDFILSITPIFQYSITPLPSSTPSLNHFVPQLEQLVDEQLPQDEDAVLLNFPPLEKAKADIIRLTFLLLHLGQTIFSEELKTSFSNS